MSQELVTYIVLGSTKRLQDIKKPISNELEEYIFSNLSIDGPNELLIDSLVSKSNGRIIVLIPPSSIPSSKARDALKKISMIDLSSWGWFKFNKKNNTLKENFLSLSAKLRSIPDISQGIYFNKRLYFSVGGIGKFENSPFKEISKRFYSRIDPQKPLPALIIRTKNLNIF